MGGTINMGGKVLYTVIHLYNSCTQYSTRLTSINEGEGFFENSLLP